MFKNKVLRSMLGLLLVLVSLNLGMLTYTGASEKDDEIYKVAELGISEEAMDYLNSAGISLFPDDYIRFSYETIKDGENSYPVKTMSILHDSGDCLSNTAFAAFSNDESEEVLPIDIPLYVSNSILSETRSNNWQSAITISGTNYFTCHWYDLNSYYVPYSVEVWYTGSSQPARISVSFQTEGELCNANHIVIDDGNGLGYVYYINRAQTLPTALQKYSNSLPLGNGNSIRNTNTLGAGMWLYFNWQVNSHTYEWTVSAMITPH